MITLLKLFVRTFAKPLSLVVVPSVFLLTLQSGVAKAFPTFSGSTGQEEFRHDLSGQIEFWRLVFGRYGKDSVVFHHRDHPEIIYSVLDLSTFHKSLSGRALAKRITVEKEKEEARIQVALRNLAKGNAPSTELEKRIARLFKPIGNSRQVYTDAASARQIRSQTGVRDRFVEGIKRSGRYLYAIEKIFRDEGLPLEISRLPLVESSFDYEAYSSVGAAGIWQFMPATGRRYMKVGRWVDERRDPIIATRAAAKYLSHAYRVLEKWPLAITSYNHGINGVLRGVKTVGSRDLSVLIERYQGRTFGFASKNFYTEFLAAVDLERDKFKLYPGIEIEKPWYFDEVRIHRNTRYSDLVRHAGMDEELFRKYNPAILKPVREGRVRVPSGTIVKVPQGGGARLVASLRHGSVHDLDEMTEQFASKSGGRRTKVYKVQPGDSIIGIAKKFSISTQELMDINDLSASRVLRIGTRLRIPTYEPVKTVRASPPRASNGNSGSSLYVVKSGDTLGEIAERNGKSISELKRLNSGLSNTIHPGQEILLSGTRVYRVVAGDTIEGIAARFGISSGDLINENNIKDPRSIQPGHMLVLPSTVSSPAPSSYTVRSGDTLIGIAKKNGTTVAGIKQLNPGISNRIYPGQRLRVH